MRSAKEYAAAPTANAAMTYVEPTASEVRGTHTAAQTSPATATA